jgi:hypothetical protein
MEPQSDNAGEIYSGRWHLTYWFPSNKQPGQEEPSEYDVTAEQTSNHIILQSIPNESESYIFVRLTVDGVFASGSWTENTSPHGEFQGMVYSGVVQLLVSPDKQKMTGQWVGVGRDHQRQLPDVYGGRWELVRI